MNKSSDPSGFRTYLKFAIAFSILIIAPLCAYYYINKADSNGEIQHVEGQDFFNRNLFNQEPPEDNFHRHFRWRTDRRGNSHEPYILRMSKKDKISTEKLQNLIQSIEKQYHRKVIVIYGEDDPYQTYRQKKSAEERHALISEFHGPKYRMLSISQTISPSTPVKQGDVTLVGITPIDAHSNTVFQYNGDTYISANEYASLDVPAGNEGGIALWIKTSSENAWSRHVSSSITPLNEPSRAISLLRSIPEVFRPQKNFANHVLTVIRVPATPKSWQPLKVNYISAPGVQSTGEPKQSPTKTYSWILKSLPVAKRFIDKPSKPIQKILGTTLIARYKWPTEIQIDALGAPHDTYVGLEDIRFFPELGAPDAVQNIPGISFKPVLYRNDYHPKWNFIYNELPFGKGRIEAQGKIISYKATNTACNFRAKFHRDLYQPSFFILSKNDNNNTSCEVCKGVTVKLVPANIEDSQNNLCNAIDKPSMIRGGAHPAMLRFGIEIDRSSIGNQSKSEIIPTEIEIGQGHMYWLTLPTSVSHQQRYFTLSVTGVFDDTELSKGIMLGIEVKTLCPQAIQNFDLVTQEY